MVYTAFANRKRVAARCQSDAVSGILLALALQSSDDAFCITYLTGMGARAAIWIVSDPRAEHVAAITWLNEAGSVMMTDFVTYLSFNGECEAAFRFYEKVLGGKILMMMRYADAPPDVPRTPKTANRIMHVRLQVGDRLLMGADAPPQFFSKPQGFSVSIMVDDPAEAERIFAQLGEAGKIMMPIAPTFWAQRFGMLIDKFGIPWMVNCEQPRT